MHLVNVKTKIVGNYVVLYKVGYHIFHLLGW